MHTVLVFGYKRWNLMPILDNLFAKNSTHTGVESLIMCALVCHFETVLHDRECEKFVFTKEDKTCEIVTLKRSFAMHGLAPWLPNSGAFDERSKRMYGEDASNQPKSVNWMEIVLITYFI